MAFMRRVSISLFVILLHSCSIEIATCFRSFDLSWNTKRGHSASSLRASEVRSDTFSENADAAGKGGPGLVVEADARSQLFSAFTALSESDKYDAVLTGLCAKLMDKDVGDAVDDDPNNNLALPPGSTSNLIVGLQDPMQLIQEMNDRRIPASPRSLQALMDVTVKVEDAPQMATIISLCRKNNAGLRQYGSLQTSVVPLPVRPNAVVRCGDGSRKTRSDRLATCNPIPQDDRSTEVTAALASSALVVGSAAAHGLHLDITPYTDTLVTGLIAVGVVDNFYDVLKFATNVAASQVVEDKKDRPSLPDKEALPAGLGSGQLSGTVLRGFTRLLSSDPVRESACEAASLFAAYTLGLPCFAFRPNALEAAVLVAESMEQNSEDRTSNTKNLDPLLNSAGIMRVLVWLMAPVAMENMKHPQLISSDPREASGMLERLEKFVENQQDESGLTQDLLWWKQEDAPASERQDLLQWAYAEAELLVRDNQAVITEIAERLQGGAATVGDCIAVLENW